MINFSTLSPSEVVSLASERGVTDVGQLNNTQRQALYRAVKRGVLQRYPSFWGGRRTYGPPSLKEK